MASINRKEARTWMVVAQCGTMGFVAVAAMVGVVGLPGLGPIDTTIPPMPEPTPVSTGSGGERSGPLAPIELEGILASLRALPNAPKVPDKPVSTPGLSPKADGDPGALAFLGAVISQNHRAAMLRIGDERAWVAEGGRVTLAGKDVRVIEVGADRVRALVDDVEQELDRASRSGSSVSSVNKSDSPDGSRSVRDPRRGTIAGARQQLLGTPEQERFAGRRAQAERLLEQANRMEDSNPQAAETMRERAKQILSINPSTAPTFRGDDGSPR